jgi:hypothetical protein
MFRPQRCNSFHGSDATSLLRKRNVQTDKKIELFIRISSGAFLICLVGYAFETEVQDELRAELCRRPRTDPLQPSREGMVFAQ